MSTGHLSDGHDETCKPRFVRAAVTAVRKLSDETREEAERKQKEIDDFKKKRRPGLRKTKAAQKPRSGEKKSKNLSPGFGPLISAPLFGDNTKLSRRKARVFRSRLEKRVESNTPANILTNGSDDWAQKDIPDFIIGKTTKSTTVHEFTPTLDVTARQSKKVAINASTGRMTTASKDVSEEIDFGRTTKESLYAMIAQDKDPKIIRIQAQIVQSFRDEISSNPAETPIEYAEQTLLRLIKERGDPKEIKLQARIVRDLEKLSSPQIPATVNTEKAKRGGLGKLNIENRQAERPEKTLNTYTKAAKNRKRARSPITAPSNTSPLASPIRGGRRPPSALRQRSESPIRVAPKRRHSPPSPTEYLSDASSYRSPPKARPYLGPPRPTIHVKKFDGKEDKWSRHIMHPASEPRAQLPKLIRAGDDLEKIQQVSTVHESYDTGITKTTQKHRRKINRTNGTRAPDLGVKRDVWAMLGARPDGSRLQPRENEGERVEETGLTAGNLRRLTEATSGEEHRTFADVVQEQLEMDDAQTIEEQFGMDGLRDIDVMDDVEEAFGVSD